MTNKLNFLKSYWPEVVEQRCCGHVYLTAEASGFCPSPAISYLRGTSSLPSLFVLVKNQKQKYLHSFFLRSIEVGVMNRRAAMLIVFFVSMFVFAIESKSLDPYKVLGVEKNASQREIQKAFHKLSLQYHPDKNKNKGAQEKFAEINNAYEILSDEDKRKNYDLYGDEKGNLGFSGGNPGDQGGYNYFTSGGPGQSGFNFRPNEWQNMGGDSGGSKSFSFSFGGPNKQSSFDFGDIFSNFFGGDMGGGSQFGGSTNSRSGSKTSPKSIRSINSQIYKKEIADKGITWLLLSYTPSLRGTQSYESIVDEVSSSLQGALKVGSVNCDAESSFCKELGVYPRRAPRLFVYSYVVSESGSLVEYSGDLTIKGLKSFCQDHLPRFSKRVDLTRFEIPSGSGENLPKVMLLSTKKDTPAIWRALSGLYKKRFMFYDAEVHDVSDPTVRKLGVDALPAVVGWLGSGEKHVLSRGISVKDLKSAIQDLSALLDNFEKKNKAANSGQKQKTKTETGDSKRLPLLTNSNFDEICNDKVPVCVIGAFRSSEGKENLETILSAVSQKSMVRRKNTAWGPNDSVSYGLVDASKQSSFMKSFDKYGFKYSDKFLVAYKPRRGKFAAYVGEITLEEIERFIGSVLNGDVQFTNTREKPTLKS